MRHDAEIVGDEDDGHVEIAAQIVEQLQDLRLYRHVKSRRRLVGDQEFRIAGNADGDHHTLAHAAGKLVRIIIHPAAGVWNIDQFQKLDGAFARLMPVDLLVDAQHLDDLFADRQDRVQRGHRLLKDHADIPAANAAPLPLGKRQQIAALEQNPPAGLGVGG